MAEIEVNEEYFLMSLSTNVSINRNGEVRGRKGNVIIPTKDETGNLVVRVNLWRGLDHYRLATLVAMMFVGNHQVPQPLWDEMVLVFKDGNVENVSAGNLEWRFPEKVLIVPGRPGFALIPGFTTYAISRSGKLIEHAPYVERPFRKRKDGYYDTSVRKDVEGREYAVVCRHRLLCLAWKPHPVPTDKLDVNHIDGIPGNDSLSNLEWATRSENMYHAYANGLRNDNMRVLVRNCENGEVTEHVSIAQCGAALGVDGETVRLRLHTEGQLVWPGGVQLKFKTDNAPWRIPEDYKGELKRSGLATGVQSRCIFTHAVKEHSSINLASEHTGVDMGSIAYKLKRGTNLIPIQGFCFKYLDDNTPWPTFNDLQLEFFRKYPRNTPKPVIVSNVMSYEEIIFASHREAAEFLGISPSGVQNNIRHGYRTGENKEFRVRYYSFKTDESEG